MTSINDNRDAITATRSPGRDRRDVKNVIGDVIEITANDVPNNGLIARINGNWTSYCH